MNCATAGFADFDLRDYYFDGLSPNDAARVEQHVKSCAPCAAELEQLRLTALALRALPDEEIPRRIAFVSDKVFEPSPIARWVQWFWLSGARMGSAAAMLLAGAILIHAFRPAQVIRVVERTPISNASLAGSAAVDRNVMQAAVDQAVAKAVSAAETRYDMKLQRVLAENERQKRDTMERVATVLDSMDRRNKVLTIASNSMVEPGQ
jgi:anti-sigma factor RsiW